LPLNNWNVFESKDYGHKITKLKTQTLRRLPEAQEVRRQASRTRLARIDSSNRGQQDVAGCGRAMTEATRALSHCIWILSLDQICLIDL
jgi:hypothetical protein